MIESDLIAWKTRMIEKQILPYILPFLFRDILLLNLCGSIIEYIINKNKVWVVMKEKKKENKKKNKAIGGFIVMIIVICL